jgi:hypothetical protein
MDNCPFSDKQDKNVCTLPAPTGWCVSDFGRKNCNRCSIEAPCSSHANFERRCCREEKMDKLEFFVFIGWKNKEKQCQPK